MRDRTSTTRSLTTAEIVRGLERHNINDPLFSYRACFRYGYEYAFKADIEHFAAMLSEPSLYIRFRNFFQQGFSACAKCGGNWGWKKYKSHYTSSDSGLFLFCVECDGIVTVEERWEALDQWKLEAIEGLSQLDLSLEMRHLEAERVGNTEFLEFPRSKK